MNIDIYIIYPVPSGYCCCCCCYPLKASWDSVIYSPLHSYAILSLFHANYFVYSINIGRQSSLGFQCQRMVCLQDQTKLSRRWDCCFCLERLWGVLHTERGAWGSKFSLLLRKGEFVILRVFLRGATKNYSELQNWNELLTRYNELFCFMRYRFWIYRIILLLSD